MPYVIAAVVVVVALFVLANAYHVVTVMEYQRALLYRNGRFARLLEPGLYRLLRWNTAVTVIDTRQAQLSLSGQDILCADGVSVRLTPALVYQIADPVIACHATASYEQAIYLTVQTLLRDLIAPLTVDEVIAQRADIGQRLTAQARERVAPYGVTLLSAEIKDIVLSAEIREAISKVVRARKEGLAALERARGETAALRNLANAARMIEQNPLLLQMRTLQVMEQTMGNTFVIGVPPSTLHPATGTPMPPTGDTD